MHKVCIAWHVLRQGVCVLRDSEGNVRLYSSVPSDTAELGLVDMDSSREEILMEKNDSAEEQTLHLAAVHDAEPD